MFPGSFRRESDYRVPDLSRRFVVISSGCAYDCSYCSHKLGAGGLVSRPVDDILDQVRSYSRADEVKRMVLTGLDTASYGKDLGVTFADLFKRVLENAAPHVEFAVAQFNPEGLGDEHARQLLLECCGDSRLVDFQLPIQTTSERLLQFMARHYRLKDVVDFVSECRRTNPGIRLRTDIMVGFPSETEAEFLDTVDMVSKYFDEIAVYGFEPKQGTPAFEQASSASVSGSVVRERMQVARDTIASRGVAVHSGGQDLNSLLECEKSQKQQRAEEEV
jgi:tRNA A37 methylthiotransferase MiaB